MDSEAAKRQDFIEENRENLQVFLKEEEKVQRQLSRESPSL
jgi:hypothetical protein